MLNRYLDLTGEDDGLAAMPLFLSLQAAIRAHVTANDAGARLDRRPRGEIAEAPVLPRAKRAARSTATRRLIAIGGLSGSGKSTLAAALAPELGAAPGARVLRSDVLRKRKFGVAPETAIPAEGYAPGVTSAVYVELCDRAAIALRAGYSAIIDAVALAPETPSLSRQ